MKKKSDAELLQAYRSLEDHDSLAALFIRYSAQVLGLCMQYLKHSADAEDAVMDIYTHIQKPLRHQNVQHFKAWIMQVSRNHCLQILRKKKGKYSIDITELNHMESTDNLHQVYIEDQWLDIMEEELENLSEEQQICLRMMYLEGHSYKEIAAIRGYELKKVKSYIQNGKRNLALRVEARKNHE